MHLFQAALLFLGCSLTTFAHPTTKVCPILGPSFPKPSNLNTNQVFRDAVKSLDTQITTALKNGTDRFGHGAFNQTTFSVSLFSAKDKGLLYQRHHTDASVAGNSNGTRHVNENTVYRIGSISKMMTVFTLLIVDGDASVNFPITKYLPQLKREPEPDFTGLGVLPLWDTITVGDFATHQGGINADYGEDDIEFDGYTRGLPPLPKSRIPICGYLEDGYHTCNKEEDLRGIASMPAIFAGGATPSYSNSGFDLVGFVIEAITGEPQEKVFNEKLVQGLGLTRAFFSFPRDAKYAAVPDGANNGGFYYNYGATDADGGNSFSTLDLAKVGQAIMSSALLPADLTRRWLKPRTFTSDPWSSVGMPWEIFRWETPTRLYDMYTKDGGVGNYASMFVLVPDLDFGFTVLTTGNVFRPPIQFQLANMMAKTMLPAVEEAARQQARENFGGRYVSREINSSITITTDDQPGLRVTEWISNGTDIFLTQFSEVDKVDYLDFRLWPNELYNYTRVGFTASWQTLPRRVQREPFGESCQTWGDTGFTLYGDVNIGAFVFELDEVGGRAMRVRPEALSITLERAG